MPKKKTKKAAAKRLKITATGKVKFKKPGHGHLLSCKSRKVKRNMRQDGVVPPSDEKRLRTMLET